MIQFFTLHREGRKIEDRRHNRVMFDLCSVATITFGGGKQYETVVDYFRAQGPYKERINQETPRGFDAATDDAANAMRGFFGGLNG